VQRSLSTQHPDYVRFAARPPYGDTKSQGHTKPFTEGPSPYEDGTHFIDPNLNNLVQTGTGNRCPYCPRARWEDLLWFQDVGAFLLVKDQWEGKHSRTAPVSHEQSLSESTVLARQTTVSEDERLEAAFETYDLMSSGYFTHVSPTLFHSGTTHPQLSSCFWCK
jgi:ribonucleotide reductase alpha subunit